MEVRAATVDDAAAMARVHIASSEDAYRPLAAAWDAPDLEARTRGWASWIEASGRVDRVAEVDGEVVGFISAGPGRDDAVRSLEVYVVHVLPEQRGAGVGGALWADACDAVRGEALEPMFLRTFAELRCCRFYEARGGEVLERRPGEFKGGAITHLVYGWAQGQSHAVGRYGRRVATDDDFEFLYALKRDAYRDHVAATYGTWDESWQRDRFTASFDPGVVEVLIVGGERIGALRVNEAQDPVFLASIEVTPARRGQGIGTAVLEDLLARGRPVRLQVFKVNEAARRLYERLGFAETGSTQTHILMST